MKRREFIITTVSGIVGATPVIALACKTSNPFTVDPNGNIRYTGNGEMYTVEELHSFIRNELDVKMDGDVLEFGEPWRITPDAATKLREGTIVQTGEDGDQEIYMSCIGVGNSKQTDFYWV